MKYESVLDPYKHITVDHGVDIRAPCLREEPFAGLLPWLDLVGSVFPDMEFCYEGNWSISHSFSVLYLLELKFYDNPDKTCDIALIWYACPELKTYVDSRKNLLESTCPFDSSDIFVVECKDKADLQERWLW